MTDQTDDARQAYEEARANALRVYRESLVGLYLLDEAGTNPDLNKGTNDALNTALDEFQSDPRAYLYIAEEHKDELLKRWLEQVGWIDKDGYCHSDKACSLMYELSPGTKEAIHKEMPMLYTLKDDSSTSQ